jgi:hypothetical protein
MHTTKGSKGLGSGTQYHPESRVETRNHQKAAVKNTTPKAGNRSHALPTTQEY